jgi:hypothetical protein
MHRSKQLVDRWHLEYDDLINDGLLKLVEVYNKNKLAKDKAVMISLVNLYNDIHERQKNAMRTVSLETLHDTIGYWGGDRRVKYCKVMLDENGTGKVRIYIDKCMRMILDEVQKGE